MKTEKPKPAEHYKREFFLTFLAMSNTKKQRLFKRYGLTGADQTAEKVWEAAK
jgi:hypothetical protein